MSPNLWCQWDTADIGDKKKLCLKAVEKNKDYCPEHVAKFPRWPF